MSGRTRWKELEWRGTTTLMSEVASAAGARGEADVPSTLSGLYLRVARPKILLRRYWDARESSKREGGLQARRCLRVRHLAIATACLGSTLANPRFVRINLGRSSRQTAMCGFDMQILAPIDDPTTRSGPAGGGDSRLEVIRCLSAVDRRLDPACPHPNHA